MWEVISHRWRETAFGLFCRATRTAIVSADFSASAAPSRERAPPRRRLTNQIVHRRVKQVFPYISCLIVVLYKSN